MSKLNDKFLAVADWVSEAMGKPGNIIVWAAFVIGWTIAFAVDKSLASSNFLPAWFTSQSYNFPLNLITTVAELFIGFLVAAATNRAQTALTNMLNLIKTETDQIDSLLKQNTELTQIIHDHVTAKTK